MSMSSFEGHFTDFPTKGCSKFSLSVARFCSSFQIFKLSNVPMLEYATIVKAKHFREQHVRHFSQKSPSR